MTNIIISWLIFIAKRILIYKLGGLPVWTDCEALRLWILKNLSVLITITERTVTKVDDKIVAFVYTICTQPALFDIIYRECQSVITESNTTNQIDTDDIVLRDRLVGRIINRIKERNRFTLDAEASPLKDSPTLILNTLSVVASIKNFFYWIENR